MFQEPVHQSTVKHSLALLTDRQGGEEESMRGPRGLCDDTQ